jgi:hypothetical protein
VRAFYDGWRSHACSHKGKDTYVTAYPLWGDARHVLSVDSRISPPSHPVPPASDAELLQHLLEAQGATPDHVAQATGITPATPAAVLAGRQCLTREHIGMLTRYFHMSPGVFTFGE